VNKLVAGVLLLLAPTFLPQQPPPSPPPVRLGGDVVLRSLLVGVDPEHPALARAARITDRVMVDVLINREGKVTATGVAGGHPLLNDAALQAVRQWQFAPILFLWEPIDVVARIPVKFSSSPLPDTPALPAGNAVISGQIRHADGRPLSNAFVLASVADAETPAVSMLVQADGTGAYRIGNLPPGTYHVQAGTATGPVTYYPGVPNLMDAMTVSVEADRTTVARIDFAIP
jgi:TonB family protein